MCVQILLGGSYRCSGILRCAKTDIRILLDLQTGFYRLVLSLTGRDLVLCLTGQDLGTVTLVKFVGQSLMF